jgi:hypothetical protein
MQSQAAGHFLYKQTSQHQVSLVPRSNHPSSHKALGRGRYPATYDMLSVCQTTWVAFVMEQWRWLLQSNRQIQAKQKHTSGPTASSMDFAALAVFGERQPHD